MSNLNERKSALRRAVLERRDGLSADARATAEPRITEQLLALTSFQHATSVLITLPFGSEFSTWDFARQTQLLGKTLVVPRVNPHRMLDLYEVVDLAADVAPGTWNIPEPVPERCRPVAPEAIDWILVPGVAFDRHGGRLGYGGGYYDRLFRLMPRLTPRVAAAFALQLVDEAPMGPYDHRVDMVVTEDETIPLESRLVG